MRADEDGPDGKPLRIAMVAPPWYELPPNGYGGIERVCADLVDALVGHGHDVTLIGAGTRTGTQARFLSTMPEPQHQQLGDEKPAVLHIARVNRMLEQGRFDVVHDHTVAGPLTASQRSVPTIVTVHNRADGELGDYYAALGHSVRLVAISNSQRRSRLDLPWAATVYNGVGPSDFAVRRSTRNGPVLWLARFSPDKGPDLAIEACRVAGLPLVLAGKCTEPGERRYLEKTMRPMLDDDVELILNADRTKVRRLLSEARCLVLPLRWPEPFGMVFVEAMAAGVPVVALRRGAAEEIVVNGRTGWLCDDPDELPDALRRVDEIDPDACVSRVRSAFSADVMARGYERVYRAAIAARAYGSRRLPRPVPVPRRIAAAAAAL